ncbi:MAG: hypothetical protein LLG93_07430 [Deltaproteobacteria bacterium]|nr:hypothetical protein [Deltaproteobacteria bacterium]
MQDFVRIFSEHPLATMAVCFAALVILYFIFKRLVKVALVILIIALAIAGYFYFKNPDQRPATLGEAWDKARDETGRVVDKGKAAVEKGKELIDKGIDAGKEAVDKGMDTADRVGKAFKEDGKDQGK